MTSLRCFRIHTLPALAVLLLMTVRTQAQEEWPPPVHDGQPHLFLRSDLLEYRRAGSAESLRWDLIGWVGGDYDRLWLRSEGSHDLSRGRSGEGDACLMYGRLVSPFWDFQLGVREEWRERPGRTRTSGVIGFEGIAPYWFDVESSLFVSERGDVSARLTADYDLLLSQRLILQPRLETVVAAGKVEQWGVGSGFNDIELGVRLRYELHRKFAPYVGFSWKRELGQTAALARREGRDVEEKSVVAGVRMWF